jgi:transcriptional regulator with XRE-family HTH domain
MTYEEVLANARREAALIGRNVRVARAQQGISRRMLARRAKVEPQTIDKLERGESTFPSVYVVRRVAGALGLTIDKLIREPLPARTPRQRRR